MGKIILKPIGFVRNKVKKPRFGGFAKEYTDIVLKKEFSEGLDGIEDYSHLIVLFWMDWVKGFHLKHQPQGKEGVPVVGTFACRCPGRPNPIGITTVRLLERQANTLTVKGLDAIDGTPIIDIKPYWPQYDRVEKEKIPSWIKKLEF